MQDLHTPGDHLSQVAVFPSQEFADIAAAKFAEGNPALSYYVESEQAYRVRQRLNRVRDRVANSTINR